MEGHEKIKTKEHHIKGKKDVLPLQHQDPRLLLATVSEAMDAPRPPQHTGQYTYRTAES